MSTFSKKHYAPIADALGVAAAHAKQVDGVRGGDVLMGCSMAVIAVSTAFGKDNPKFDASKFNMAVQASASKHTQAG